MTWAFGGVSFAVVSDGPFDQEWFAATVERTVDLVAGGTTRYVDIGATSMAPLSLVAQFADASTRTSLMGLRGALGTLTDDDGRSATVRLVGTTEIRVKKKASGLYRLAVEFEFVS
jgi:hypothetical protein